MGFEHAAGGQKVVHTDVLVVGSGLIGAVYARTISDAIQDVKILMVDIGEQDLPNPIHHNPDQAIHENLPAAVAIREVGGMGNYWTCCTPEQHPILERSDIFSDKEWQQLYHEARALFHTTEHAFDHSMRQKILQKKLRQSFPNREFKGMPLGCQPNESNPDYVEWTSTATILGDLAQPSPGQNNFQVKSQYCCTRLHIDFAQGRVVAAELKNLVENSILLVKAKKFVITAGAVLSAGILFRSGIRPDNGYPALVCLMDDPSGDTARHETGGTDSQQGHYLTEQIVSLCQIRLNADLLQPNPDDPAHKKHKKSFPNDALGIPFNDPDPQLTTPMTLARPWHTQIHRDAFGYGSVPRDIDQRLILDLRFFTHVEIAHHNCVKFSDKISDIFGMPQPTFHFQPGEQDVQRSRDMMTDMVRIATSLGGFIPGQEPRFIPPGAALHICGTTRASPVDDGTSVVDRHSKVWRIENLFVGGCGVIPTQNATNPTLTAACFAIVGARKVAQELKQMRRLQTGLEPSRI
ncbi:Pyranose 2-oxidase [Beauveria bassiana]|nr:Pyranose 2-oxidase [Beauveria bassiana]KAH8711469.1 Pyranose 2-oxidase [Beauveria bassiana]